MWPSLTHVSAGRPFLVTSFLPDQRRKSALFLLNLVPTIVFTTRDHQFRGHHHHHAWYLYWFNTDTSPTLFYRFDRALKDLSRNLFESRGKQCVVNRNDEKGEHNSVKLKSKARAGSASGSIMTTRTNDESYNGSKHHQHRHQVGIKPILKHARSQSGIRSDFSHDLEYETSFTKHNKYWFDVHVFSLG